MHFVGCDRIERRGKADSSLLRVMDAAYRIQKTLPIAQLPVGPCQERRRYPSGHAIGGEEKRLLQIRNRLGVVFVLAQFIATASIHLSFQPGIAMLVDKRHSLFEKLHADPQM